MDEASDVPAYWIQSNAFYCFCGAKTEGNHKFRVIGDKQLKCFTCLGIFILFFCLIQTTPVGGLQHWHLSCFCARRQIKTLTWLTVGSPSLKVFHIHMFPAVSGVLWTTEQIAGRFIGETVRQLGTHHIAKQMFRWLGEELERNGRRVGGDAEEEVCWWGLKRWINTLMQGLWDFIWKNLSSCKVGQKFFHFPQFCLCHTQPPGCFCSRSNALDLLTICLDAKEDEDGSLIWCLNSDTP